MYDSNNISLKIKQIAKSKNITISKMLADVKLGSNTMSNFKTSMPKADTLAKIADYLNVSVDVLLGREYPATPYDELNELGKSKADDYINDLLETPKYTKTKQQY